MFKKATRVIRLVGIFDNIGLSSRFNDSTSFETINLEYFDQLEEFSMVLVVSMSFLTFLRIYGCVSLNDLWFILCRFASFDNFVIGVSYTFKEEPWYIGSSLQLGNSWFKILQTIDGNTPYLWQLDVVEHFVLTWKGYPIHWADWFLWWPKTLNALSSLIFSIISWCWKLKEVPLRCVILFNVEILPHDVQKCLSKEHDWLKCMQGHVGQTQSSQAQQSMS